MDFTPMMEVDRTRPHAELDGTDIDPRLSRYREQFSMPIIVTKHALADEGSFYMATNDQTGLATAAAPTAFSATNPFLILYNNGYPSDEVAPRFYLDYLMLLNTAPGTGPTSLQCAITKDRGNRYTSGGTELTSKVTNLGPTSVASVAKLYAGNLTASAATASVRTLIGNRWLKGAIPVIGDQYTIRSGAAGIPDMITISTIMANTQNIPPIVLGPDESLLFHLWLPAQSVASSFLPEIGWWER
jgi:hypothetical protein